MVLGLGTKSYEGAAMEIQGSQICYSSAEMPIPTFLKVNYPRFFELGDFSFFF